MSNVGGSTPRGGSRAGEAQIFGRRAGLALAAIVALIGLAASARSEAHAFPTQGNLITTNSSFEVDANNDGFADGWVEYVNVATANLSAVEFVDGAHSQHLTTDTLNGAFSPRIRYAGGSAAGGTIPVVQNQPYTFAIWFKAAPGVSGIANIKGYNAAGGEFGVQTSTTKPGNGAWQRIFINQTFTNPLQVNASVLAGVGTPITGGFEVYLDAAEFGPDTDKDGVLDTVDLCPSTPNGATVDTSGCPPTRLWQLTNTAVGGYVNTPVVSNGVLVLRNTNARPSGSGAYVTGVGSAHIGLTYATGDALQWAIQACSPTGSPFLNLGVQSGSGDTNNLSVTSSAQMHPTGSYAWLVTSAVAVDLVKPTVYFWIPGSIGQEVDVRTVLLGDPNSISTFIAAHGSGIGDPCPLDTTPPVITAPANITVTTAGPSGAIVSYPPATATDLADGSAPVVCSPASGSTFAIGTASVNCSATDVRGNTSSASFSVTVLTAQQAATALAGQIAGSGANGATKVLAAALFMSVQRYLGLPNGLGRPGACLLLTNLARQIASSSEPAVMAARGGLSGWLAQIDAMTTAVPCT